jgi:hypothetical protein
VVWLLTRLHITTLAIETKKNGEAMPYSDYHPELMGSATIEPSGAFEAGSYQSFVLTYTAGRFGIDDTGGLKVGFRFASDMSKLQFDDPTGEGFTTIEASNGATLDVKQEFKRNIRPWSKSLFIGISEHFLAEGDTITIRVGDNRQGSPGVRIQTFCEADHLFQFFIDAIATYDYVPLPASPSIAIVPGKPLTYRAFLPTKVAAGEPFRLCIKADDIWGNPSNQVEETLYLEADGPINELPESVTFKKGEFSAIVEGLSVDKARKVKVKFKSSGNVLGESNPLFVAEKPDLLHYWADIHGQSNETLGTNTALDYFTFGRDKAFLDVCAHQGNDFQMTEKFWKELNQITSDFDKPGLFVAIPGYEWSSNTAVGGDRNVFYRQEGEVMHRSSHMQIPDLSDEETDAYDAHELFKKLEGKDAVVMAHCGGRYANIGFAHDGRMEMAMEIHSAWGTFEWLIRDALEAGHRIGVVANSDGHKGRVGASYPGASFFGAYGGLTCYIAPRLDRDGIFEAIRARHNYGTTGTRLYMDVQVSAAAPLTLYDRDPDLFDSITITEAKQAMMGDIAKATGQTINLKAHIIGSAPIQKIELREGLETLETWHGYNESQLGKRIRVQFEGAKYRGRARALSWDGSLSLEGNSIERSLQYNCWNPERGLKPQDDHNLAWSFVTTGNFNGFDLWLNDRDSGKLSISTPFGETTIDVGSIGFEPQSFFEGGLGRAMKVYRLPDELTESDVTLDREITLHKDRDTRPWICVTQIDGHQAWSSPVYLMK